MEQLSAQDAQFLYMEDADIVANITGAYILDQSTAPDGIVRFRDIIDKIEERFSKSKLFRRKLMRVPMEMDYPYWVDDPYFDIEHHVHHARLPEPADWRQFCIHFARYHSRPLDLGRPLWEIYIVEGLDNIEGVPKGSFAMIIKVHHAAVDGTAGIQLLGALMDLAPNGPPAFRYPDDIERQPTATLPPMASMLARASWNNFRSPYRFADAARRQSPQIARAMAEFGRARMTRKKSTAPKTIFNGKISPHKSFDAMEVGLDEVKLIRKAFPEAKVNDVVLATVGGGLRKYLQSKNALPKESLIAVAPINARAQAGSGIDKDAKGNHVSAMTTPIHTQIEHPVERLKAIVQSTRRSKAAKDGVGARVMTDLSQYAPAAMMAVGARVAARAIASSEPMQNLFVSNVPGPQTPLYFCGAKMLSMYGMAPVNDGMGLFIATPSYNGKITFGVTSTRQIIPDTPFFINCLKMAFAELKAAAVKRLEAGDVATPKRKPRKTAKAQRKPSSTKAEKKKKKKKPKKKKPASTANGSTQAS